MRAVYFKGPVEQSPIVLKDDGFHHLKNVVRTRVDDEVLVLNGKGLKVYTKVLSIEKKQIVLEEIKREVVEKKEHFSLAICLPKKEFFEDAMRIAIQVGIHEIYPLNSEYSQWTYSPSSRLEKILNSSLIQSNNPFYPEIHEPEDLKEFLSKLESPLHYFSSQNVENSKTSVEFGQKYLIGPEAGFSSEEMQLLENNINCFAHHLPTPIFTTVNATGIGFGYLMGRV